DLNGDGAPDLLVGASAESSVAAGAGAVYLLAAPRTDSIGSIALGKITGDQAGDFLGDRAVDSGDFDGDGRPDLALAAPSRSGRAEGAGAAWVFYGPGGGTRSVATAEVQLWGMNARGAFGTDLAVIPDSNGDGTDELAISAEEGDGLLADAGVVWIWLGG
ncbi:MAG TPA: FG-GAP and VCBS repeat-containing protein, partial [Myxococcota bacterium]|nr:FG-GAP and VCBS repeat-containing protein [Myxococcota bacterium]